MDQFPLKVTLADSAEPTVIIRTERDEIRLDASQAVALACKLMDLQSAHAAHLSFLRGRRSVSDTGIDKPTVVQ